MPRRLGSARPSWWTASLATALVAGAALAVPDRAGGPPGRSSGPGDITRPPTGAPAAPRAPGTPTTSGGVESTAVPSGQQQLLEMLAGATGVDTEGLVQGSGSPSLLDAMFDSLLRASTPPETGVEFVPIPVVTFSRNEGPTYGAIAPIFFRNTEGEVSRVFAPTFTYNDLFGFEGGFHALAYEGDLTIAAGAIVSSKVARNLYLQLLHESLVDGAMAGEFFLKNEVDPSSRFYGFGPATTSDDETNDTHRETVARWNVGWNVTSRIQLMARLRFRDVKISGRQIRSLPSTPDEFAGAPGIPGATILGPGIELRWDGRDEAFLPKQGFYLGAVIEQNFGLTGSTSRFYPRFLLDARGYVSPWPEYLTLAGRVRIERLTGGRVPFYEQAILGGPLTIRAYGSDRFTDLASVLFQVEARVTVLRVKIFGSRTEWSVVPFFDYGRVFRDFRGNLFQRWRWSPGVGFRLAVPPNIIGRVDVAYGHEGANVFVGLGLPF